MYLSHFTFLYSYVCHPREQFSPEGEPTSGASGTGVQARLFLSVSPEDPLILLNDVSESNSSPSLSPPILWALTMPRATSFVGDEPAASFP